MATREMIECQSCQGSGGPPDFWNEDTRRWEHRVCGSCSGQGYRFMWVGDDDD